MHRLKFFGSLLAVCAANMGQAREPLIMDGKDTLFERVLVREATQEFDSPDGAAGPDVLPLQTLFVYARDNGWIQVGSDDEGTDLFWIAEADSVQWRQNIVATFDGSADLDRVMFFATEDDVYEVIEAESPEIPTEKYRDEAMAAEQKGEASDRVIALGPVATPDLRENLYIMPILDSEGAAFESNGADVNILKVAVARAGATSQSVQSTAIDIVPIPDVDRENYKAAVVFVVDTTLSMEPYINATEAAMKEVYQTFADRGIEDAVSFGLIGYRDNLEAAPGLGYDVETFVSLVQGQDKDTFFAGISTMNEAQDSSRHFREDAFMGIDYAINQLDWSDYGARYIVLVTDASPRPASDPLSRTGLTPGALKSLVGERLNAVISILHLKTERGAHDHDIAEAAYRELAHSGGGSSLYQAVPKGDEVIYRQAARSIGEVVTQQVIDFRAGDLPINEGGRPILKATPDQSEFGAALSSAGRTMQLAYLGRQSGAEAPDVFEAYIADRDFSRPGIAPLSIRLLLNKSELSDLSEALQIIFEQGEENITTPDQMFTQILSAAADMSRRPDKVSRNSETTLAEAVSIDELLEGLPYQSSIMNLTQDDWVNMGISEQQVRMTELADKIELYFRFNEATDLWVDYLGTGTGADALVYPMKLNDLP